VSLGETVVLSGPAVHIARIEIDWNGDAYGQRGGA
jgi:hypothetical protein